MQRTNRKGYQIFTNFGGGRFWSNIEASSICIFESFSCSVAQLKLILYWYCLVEFTEHHINKHTQDHIDHGYPLN